VLHDWRIDPSEYERHEQRRGRRHAFGHIDPATSALVVVDMIPFFVETNLYAAGIVAHIDRLATAVRAGGGLVAWVVPAATKPTERDIEFFGAEVAALYSSTSVGAEIPNRVWRGLHTDAADLFVEKTMRGALFPGSSDLHERLQAFGIDTVLICGVAADVCCESTVREAHGLDYRVVMVADANAAVSDTALNAALRTVYRSFGDVRPTDDVIAALSS